MEKMKGGRQVLYYEVDGEHYKVQGAPPIFGIYKRKKTGQGYVLKKAVKAKSGVLAFRKFLSELRETKQETKQETKHENKKRLWG